MTNKEIQRHIKNLKMLFPDSFIENGAEFDGRSNCIWTGFGEDGTSDYWRGGWPNEHHPTLLSYMDDNGLWAEWHDPGTLMIYSE